MSGRSKLWKINPKGNGTLRLHAQELEELIRKAQNTGESSQILRKEIHAPSII